MAKKSSMYFNLIVIVLLSVFNLIHGEDIDCTYSNIYPRQYVAYKLEPGTLDSTMLDGDLTKQVWEEVPWSDDFVDISTTTLPKFNTRVKIRWDNDFLYVGAQLQETQVWATLTEHDSVIYYDNDFEIFVDGNATTHYYKEYEMNAFNTTWDLCLNQPYANNGYENSSRVFGTKGFDMQPPLRCGVTIEPNTINDPAAENTYWSVEVALPLSSLMLNNTSTAPVHNTMWRINFSRVEWAVVVNETTQEYVVEPSCQSCSEPGDAVEDNWVWSPMYAVAMHAPERWGILQFSTDLASTTTSPLYYDEWPARAAAVAIYNAEYLFFSDHAVFTTNYDILFSNYSSSPFEICSIPQDVNIMLSDDKLSFTIEVTSFTQDGNEIVAMIQDDRFLTVRK